MNERIRELAEQADIHFSKSGTLDAGPNGIAKFVLYADLEKFAELIVAECAELCSDLDGGENMFSRGIRRHFGVRE